MFSCIGVKYVLFHCQWNRTQTKNILCQSIVSFGGEKIWREKIWREKIWRENIKAGNPKKWFYLFHDWKVFYQFLWLYLIAKPRNVHKREGILNTVDLLSEIACFAEKRIYLKSNKAYNLISQFSNAHWKLQTIIGIS